jgi:hypothetical protein
MEKDYTTKELKTKKKVEKIELPIYQKRQHWCFKKDGQLFKFASKELAEKAYKGK